MRKFLLLIPCILGAVFLARSNADNRVKYKDFPAGQIVITTKQVVNDFQCIPAPGNPPTGNVRVYCDSGTGLFNCLTSSGAACVAGSSTSPGGANTQVQFNDSGAFGGNSGLTFVKATGQFQSTGSGAADSYVLVNGTGGFSAVEVQGPGVNVDSTTTGGVVDIYTTSGNIAIDPGATKHLTIGGGSQSNSGHIRLQGASGGFADFGVADTAGSPARINVPTATGVNGQFFKTDGGSPQQTSWGLIAQSGAIHSTANVGAISTATLCAASAGACNVAGQYHIHFAFIETGTACATPATGGVTFLLTWTDSNAVTHSAVSIGFDDASAINAVSQTFHFQTSLAAAWGSGDFNVSTNGSIIQYATGYTACGVGTGTYQLDAAVTRLQ